MDLGEGELGLNIEIIYYKRNLNDIYIMLISFLLFYYFFFIL